MCKCEIKKHFFSVTFQKATACMKRITHTVSFFTSLHKRSQFGSLFQNTSRIKVRNTADISKQLRKIFRKEWDFKSVLNAEWDKGSRLKNIPEGSSNNKAFRKTMYPSARQQSFCDSCKKKRELRTHWKESIMISVVLRSFSVN